MSALTHQQRAERAIGLLLKQRWMRAFRENDLNQLDTQTEDADLIAREMFPRELVEFVEWMIRTINGIADERSGKVYLGDGDRAGLVMKARSALDLYPEPEEPDHEPG